LLALAENNAKFTPSPSQEAPLGYGRPTRTCVPLLDVTNRAGSAGEYTCVESKSLDDSLAMQDGLSLPLCRRSNNRLIYSRTLKALRKIFHEVLSVSATVEPCRESCLSPLFQTGLRRAGQIRGVNLCWPNAYAAELPYPTVDFHLSTRTLMILRRSRRPESANQKYKRYTHQHEPSQRREAIQKSQKSSLPLQQTESLRLRVHRRIRMRKSARAKIVRQSGEQLSVPLIKRRRMRHQYALMVLRSSRQ